MSEELPQDMLEVAGVKDAAAPAHPAWLPFAIDFGPLLVFFLTFRLTKSDGAFGATTGAIKATGAFMVAIIIAMALSQWKLRKIPPMLWMSAILVLGFGALTIYFHDARFIQIKPTIIYAGFAVLLLGGWMRGKPLIKYLMQAAFDGLSDEGWLKLSRNWGLFFVAMAAINEGLRAMVSFDTWLSVKVWGLTIFSVVFAISQMPLMLRHGLGVDENNDG
ncbi:MAG: septation protein IspZ [Sphingopyxis sp.]